jgi:GNAT superfamily N-acetyltransferase
VNQRAGMTSVYVTTTADHVAGFYALSAGGVEPKDAPQRITKGVLRHPVPVVVLTRLAVAEKYQGHGLGKLLLSDALLRTNQAADQIGIRALLIHAKDSEDRAFYLRLAEFEESPTDPLHLLLLMKDLRAALVREQPRRVRCPEAAG